MTKSTTTAASNNDTETTTTTKTTTIDDNTTESASSSSATTTTTHDDDQKKKKNTTTTTTGGGSSSSSGKPQGIRKLRKARVQVKQRKNLNLQREEGGGDYNIWYHKFLGQGRDKPSTEPATTRVSIKKDSGWTIGCTEREPYFCLFFARGCCSSGPDCHYLHRLPTQMDESRIPITKDVFSRDKHATDREDMGGVGSFNREGRTIYVSGVKNVKNLQQLLIDNFKEFGELEYVRAFPDRCYAFVKFKLRLCAEFAREAMMNQSLSDQTKDVLQIRWATDDPNPIAARRNALEMKTKLIEKIVTQQQQQQQQQQLQAIQQGSTGGGIIPMAITASSTQENQGVTVGTRDYAFNYPLNYAADNALVPEQLKDTLQEDEAFNKNRFNKQQQQKMRSTKTTTNTTTTTSNEEAAVDRKRLDYFHFIQETMNEAHDKLSQLTSQNRDIYRQRSVLNSNVVDAYPNTEQQYYQAQQQQQQPQQQAANFQGTPEQYQQYLNNYNSFFQQFQNQLGGGGGGSSSSGDNK